MGREDAFLLFYTKILQFLDSVMMEFSPYLNI